MIRGARAGQVYGHAGGGEVVQLRFGEQLHTRVLRGGEDGHPLNPEQVAAYVAKYSCKGSHEQITRRGAGPDQLRENGGARAARADGHGRDPRR